MHTAEDEPPIHMSEAGFFGGSSSLSKSSLSPAVRIGPLTKSENVLQVRQSMAILRCEVFCVVRVVLKMSQSLLDGHRSDPVL